MLKLVGYCPEDFLMSLHKGLDILKANIPESYESIVEVIEDWAAKSAS